MRNQLYDLTPNFQTFKLSNSSNTEHGTRNTEHRTQNTEHRTQNAEHGTRNTERRTQNTEHGTRNAEHGTQNTEPINQFQVSQYLSRNRDTIWLRLRGAQLK